jgi:tetratricopeptide (TPR) repeat protein
VNLPFVDAVKDPSRIRWRFGAISSTKQPPIVLEGLPVCGNCHSFPREGTTLAMDIDYANSKGSYVIVPVAEDMVLATSNVITWDDYRKEDGQLTFGLLSQISPDGRFVVSTVKDESVFVPRPELAFSQLFFPVKGILCVYDRQTGTFASLPGADDPQYVQSNPSWSPDGKYIVFARAKAYTLRKADNKDKVLLSAEECKEFLEEGKTFLFDLYRIPFNSGKGGVPEPLDGASNNGMSNYFAKYSPDGKWIVFCKAKSYMLLQPDSELYIIPADGGEARRLQCNTGRMNSWHSWSPNGKWLVFSSKAYSVYTQLFVTHIDEEGNSTPPVLLSHLTAPDRAANIPEFVKIDPHAIRTIREQFVDDLSFVRAAGQFIKSRDFDRAVGACRKALELNPKNAEAHHTLAFALKNKGMLKEGIPHLQEAIRLDPNHIDARYNLGLAMTYEGKLDEAVTHFTKVLQLDPNHAKAHADLASVLLLKGMPAQAAAHLSQAIRIEPNYANAYYNLAEAMLQQEKPDAAIEYLQQVLRIEPNDAQAHYKLAQIWALKGRNNEALKHYSDAISIKPDIDTSALLHILLARNYAESRRFHEAVLSEEKALKLARVAGDRELIQKIEKNLEMYRLLDKSGPAPIVPRR